MIYVVFPIRKGNPLDLIFVANSPTDDVSDPATERPLESLKTTDVKARRDLRFGF